MKWLDRWLARRVERAQIAAKANDRWGEEPVQLTSNNFSRLNFVNTSVPHESGTRLRSQGMPFTIYNANGGYVIEYHSYDNKRDESTHRIHVIPEGDDANDALAKIIMLEIIRS